MFLRTLFLFCFCFVFLMCLLSDTLFGFWWVLCFLFLPLFLLFLLRVLFVLRFSLSALGPGHDNPPHQVSTAAGVWGLPSGA